MSAGGFIAGLFKMDDATWKRHASGWSVWSRMALLPVFTLAVWSRIWTGPWIMAAIFVALIVFT